MATTTDTTITARGKVTAKNGATIKFVPQNTAYELHLVAPDFQGPMNTLVDGVIRARARKAYTVPSGGNFLSPIFGPGWFSAGRRSG